MNYNFYTFKKAFIITIPVLLGYLAIGTAFGLLLVKAGYSWWLAPVMSILIYAGAGQYVAVTLFSQNASLIDVAIITFLVNSRHIVYGLSLLDKYKISTGFYKFYLIFSLTDETYALLTSGNEPDDVDKKLYNFFIGLLDHFYWTLGGVIGAIFGSVINFNSKGLDFALTSLFIVLLIEQIKKCKTILPFFIAFIGGLIGIIINKNNMLIISIVFSITVFLIVYKILHNKGKIQKCN